MREVQEKVAARLKNPRPCGVIAYPEVDIRDRPYSKIKETVMYENLPNDISDEEIIRYHYGVPDEIFIGNVNPDEIRDTHELKSSFVTIGDTRISAINIREIGIDDLSVSHGVIVMAYSRCSMRITAMSPSAPGSKASHPISLPTGKDS
jgi:hypothetical protein